MNIVHEKISVLTYNTLCEGSVIFFLERGIAIKPRYFHSRIFHAVFDLTPDRAASECQISLPDQGNKTLELRLDMSLP